LRAHQDKTKRERDLENKVAIVLAENEKLNQVIEEISNLQRNSALGDLGYPTGDGNEKVQHILKELDEWKGKYHQLESSGKKSGPGGSGFDELDRLRKENQDLRDQLKKDGRLFKMTSLNMDDKEQDLKAGLGESQSQQDVIKKLADEVKVLRKENGELNQVIDQLKRGSQGDLATKI